MAYTIESPTRWNCYLSAVSIFDKLIYFVQRLLVVLNIVLLSGLFRNFDERNQAVTIGFHAIL